MRWGWELREWTLIAACPWNLKESSYWTECQQKKSLLRRHKTLCNTIENTPVRDWSVLLQCKTSPKRCLCKLSFVPMRTLNKTPLSCIVSFAFGSDRSVTSLNEVGLPFVGKRIVWRFAAGCLGGPMWIFPWLEPLFGHPCLRASIGRFPLLRCFLA